MGSRMVSVPYQKSALGTDPVHSSSDVGGMGWGILD